MPPKFLLYILQLLSGIGLLIFHTLEKKGINQLLGFAFKLKNC